jgi:hypothetical protein
MHGRLEGRRPSHGELGCAGVAPRPRGSDARTLRVGGWGGLRRHILRPSYTLTERVPTVGKVDGPPSGTEEGGSQEVS